MRKRLSPLMVGTLADLIAQKQKEDSRYTQKSTIVRS